MGKEIIPIKLTDLEILEAQETTMKLLREFKASTDPLTKKAVKEMVYDAFNHEVELKLGSRAKDAVENIHEIQNPVINPN